MARCGIDAFVALYVATRSNDVPIDLALQIATAQVALPLIGYEHDSQGAVQGITSTYSNIRTALDEVARLIKN